MTLPLSTRPSLWHNHPRPDPRPDPPPCLPFSYLPKPVSLLSDATIDPFPQRFTRSASLLEHHIVPGPCEESASATEAPWRRNTHPLLPRYPHPPDHKAAPPPPLPPPPPPSSSSCSPRPPLPPPQALLQPKPEECYHMISAKPNVSATAAKKEDIEPSSMVASARTQAQDSTPAVNGTVVNGTAVNGGYCLCQPEPKIPRPRNAFILYRQHQQAAVVRQYPGLPNPAISKIIGEQWSKLPEDQKQRWRALAEEEKARHALQYPDYRYQPRRNGRYSAASSGHTSGQSTAAGLKVDSDGNCIKCGGRTMNPPATPHPPYSPPPPPPQDRDRVRSPSYGGVPYDTREPHNIPYHYQHPRQDSRYQPTYRQSISVSHQPTSMIEPYGHDIKRRRFDGSGIYIPTREYRGDPGYAYSPRVPPPLPSLPPPPPLAPYQRNDIRAREMHDPRSPTASPRRAQFPSGTTRGSSPGPILQPIKLAQNQSRRRESTVVKLPSLPSLPSPREKTPTANVDRDSDNKVRASQHPQDPDLAAIIMSIPVLNKIKTLSTVSPSLAAPQPGSTRPIIRGAVVAIDGPDPHLVWGMASSLKMQLEREGNLVAKIFTGPDPAKFLGAGTASDVTSGDPASTADILRLIEEWHKVSNEIRQYITTIPGPGKDDVSVSVPAARRMSFRDVEMLDAPDTSLDKRKSSDVSMADHPIPRITSQKEEAMGHSGGMKTRSHSHPSAQSSPSKTSKAASTAVPSPCSRVTRSRSTASTNTAMSTHTATSKTTPTAASASASASASRIDSLSLNSPSVAKQPGSPTASAVTTTSTAHSSTTLTSPSPMPSPTPIAIVPHYQLSTTNYCAIQTPISDAYSPASHWQWVAALWRGAIGPDVTIAVRPVDIAASSDEESSVGTGVGTGVHITPYYGAGAGTGARLGSFDGAPQSNCDERSSTTASVTTNGRQSLSQGSPSYSHGQVNGGGGGGGGGGPSASWRTENAPGVEVRLQDYRTVLVRTMRRGRKPAGSSGGRDEEEANRDEDGEGEKEDEDRRVADEFWEKVKRRVGFEVAEFLRR